MPLRPSRLLLCLLIAAAVPASSLAQPPRKAPVSDAVKTMCNNRHIKCVEYCIQSGKRDKELNTCTENCAGMVSRCYDRGSWG